jgi:hypothetical protein
MSPVGLRQEVGKNAPRTFPATSIDPDRILRYKAQP